MIRFRNATEDELGTVLAWAAAEGWNPGLDDAAAFFAADPAGFFLAMEETTPVGAISVVNHSDDFAFLGLYIVQPSHRGRGIGYALWQHAIEHAGARTVGLDGVPEQQANYAVSGFQHAGRTMRFLGTVDPKAVDGVRLAGDADIPMLIDREADASGARKAAYLSAWFRNTPNRRTLIEDDGFLTVRACRDGAKIGPLVAADEASARRLIQHAATVFGEKLSIDVPETATGLKKLCEDQDLEPVFGTARMYRGTPKRGTGEFYSVASLELG